MSATNLNTYAREYALKYLYHLQLEEFGELKKKYVGTAHSLKGMEQAVADFDESFQEEDNEHPDNLINDSVKAYANRLIEGVLERYNEIEEVLKSNLVKWNIDRLDKLDLSLLLIGIYELYHEQTPKKVVIDEAVKLAKKYGTKESYSFVNGVLDAISSKMPQKDRKE